MFTCGCVCLSVCCHVYCVVENGDRETENWVEKMYKNAQGHLRILMIKQTNKKPLLAIILIVRCGEVSLKYQDCKTETLWRQLEKQCSSCSYLYVYVNIQFPLFFFLSWITPCANKLMCKNPGQHVTSASLILFLPVLACKILTIVTFTQMSYNTIQLLSVEMIFFL